MAGVAIEDVLTILVLEGTENEEPDVKQEIPDVRTNGFDRGVRKPLLTKKLNVFSERMAIRWLTSLKPAATLNEDLTVILYMKKLTNTYGNSNLTRYEPWIMQNSTLEMRTNSRLVGVTQWLVEAGGKSDNSGAGGYDLHIIGGIPYNFRLIGHRKQANVKKELLGSEMA